VYQASAGEVPECGNHVRHSLTPGHVSKGTFLPYRVLDPHSFIADPDPAFYLITAPDSDPDPVPNPFFDDQKKEKKLQMKKYYFF
jgi:hypothetical protein